jgi:carbamoyl-phosphate synthase small subunit
MTVKLSTLFSSSTTQIRVNPTIIERYLSPLLYSRLALADGTVMDGGGAGVAGVVSGELVFQTGMVGYQEALTDPSYAGQILMFSYPLIGNYGAAASACEGPVRARAAIVQELHESAGHYAADGHLHDFLTAQGVPTVTGVDTRALVRHIRTSGVMPAAVATAPHPDDLPLAASLVAIANRAKVSTDLVAACTVTIPTWYPPTHLDRPTIALLDYGAKRSIVERLRRAGVGFWLLPAHTTAAQIRALHPDGVLLSNGPGDPAALDYAVATVRGLLAARLPIMGICLGHQVLARALGARTFKMTHGHRGINQPVLELASRRVLITTQNHGYSVDPTSLPGDVLVTHTNLNDATVEGIAHRYLPAWSVQWHPEAHPGPADSDALFDRFLAAVSPSFIRGEGWRGGESLFAPGGEVAHAA